jgi:hypothetical protein
MYAVFVSIPVISNESRDKREGVFYIFSMGYWCKWKWGVKMKKRKRTGQKIPGSSACIFLLQPGRDISRLSATKNRWGI